MDNIDHSNIIAKTDDNDVNKHGSSESIEPSSSSSCSASSPALSNSPSTRSVHNNYSNSIYYSSIKKFQDSNNQEKIYKNLVQVSIDNQTNQTNSGLIKIAKQDFSSFGINKINNETASSKYNTLSSFTPSRMVSVAETTETKFNTATKSILNQHKNNEISTPFRQNQINKISSPASIKKTPNKSMTSTFQLNNVDMGGDNKDDSINTAEEIASQQGKYI